MVEENKVKKEIRETRLVAELVTCRTEENIVLKEAVWNAKLSWFERKRNDIYKMV